MTHGVEAPVRWTVAEATGRPAVAGMISVWMPDRVPGPGIHLPEPSTNPASLAITSPVSPLGRGRESGWTALAEAAAANLWAPARFLAAVRTPCPTCGLGPDGLSDPVGRGLHFCDRRRRTLGEGLGPAVPPEALRSREVLAELDEATLRSLGRPASAFRATGSGFERVRWEEVSDWVRTAERPWWLPGSELGLEVHVAARRLFGPEALSPAPPAAVVLAAAAGTVLAPMPATALARAGWIVVAAGRGVDPTATRPVLSRWLSDARGPVIAVGARVRGATAFVPCPPERVAELLAAVADGSHPPGLPEAQLEELRRLCRGPGVVVADGDDAALATATLALTAHLPPGPAHGWLWLWDPVPPPFDPPTSAPDDPDLVVLHGNPVLTPALAEAVRRAPRRLHLAVHLDPTLAWPGDAVLLPARPAWEQDGVSFVALDRRVRFGGVSAWDPLGESRSDLDLLRFLASAWGRTPAPSAATIRSTTAAGDARYRGWDTLHHPGDHVFLGGPFLSPGAR
jgi:hypothetical protein